MKKLLMLLVLTFSLAIATHAQDNKDKTKPTSTIPQKVHNTVSKHKKHKGYKTKHKHNGHTTKHKVDMKEGEVKDKSK
ncbi:MAG: hypothetical protein ABI683_12715 [Ginsengibacter sp.]